MPEEWQDIEINRGAHFYAIHDEQRIYSRYQDGGIHLSSTSRTHTENDSGSIYTTWSLKMNVLSFAGESISTAAHPQVDEQDQTKATYRHNENLEEWFINSAGKIEHGYTVSSRPHTFSEDAPIVVEVGLDGLRAHAAEGSPNDLEFHSADHRILKYANLRVFDATGRELSSSMYPTETGFALAYNDKDASYPVTIDPWITSFEAELGTDANPEDTEFGRSLALDGDTAIIGAPGDDDGGLEAGAAYVFARNANNDWKFQAKLRANDASLGDQFGFAVDIDSDTIVVGAYREGPTVTLPTGTVEFDFGSLYIFEREGVEWTQTQKIRLPDAADDDFFGYAVAISGDTIISSAIGDSDVAQRAGSVGVFARVDDQWELQQKLVAADGSENDWFGYDVALDGDRALIGALRDDPAGNDSGSAYLFFRENGIWSQEAYLTPVDAAAGDQFGISVGLSGNTAVIGASGDDDAFAASGSSYIFEKGGDTWAEAQKLNAPDAAATDAFGQSVDISQDVIIIGAPRADQEGKNDVGKAYVFEKPGGLWSFVGSPLTAGTRAEANDLFGQAVVVSNGHALVGSHRRDSEAENSGVATFFERGTSDWDGDNFPDEVTSNSSGINGAPTTALAISGRSIAIGVPGNDAIARNVGSVFLFQYDGEEWLFDQKLHEESPYPENQFGVALDIDGTTLLIGTRSSRLFESVGSAYLYSREDDLWTMGKQLLPEKLQVNYGLSVALSHGQAAVGSPSFTEPGAVHLFRNYDGYWFFEQEIPAPEMNPDAEFGASLRFMEKSLLVGAPGYAPISPIEPTQTVPGSGAVYLYRDTSTKGWAQEEGKFELPDGPQAGANFGRCLTSSGTTFAVSAPGFTDSEVSGSRHGRVFIHRDLGFIATSSTLVQSVQASDSSSNDLFGSSISMSGDLLAIGSMKRTQTADGALYLFGRKPPTNPLVQPSWQLDFKHLAPDLSMNLRIGDVVAASPESIVSTLTSAFSVSNQIHVLRREAQDLIEFAVLDEEGRVLGNGSSLQFPPTSSNQISTIKIEIKNLGNLPLTLHSIGFTDENTAEFGLSNNSFSTPTQIAGRSSLFIDVDFMPGSSSGTCTTNLQLTTDSEEFPDREFRLEGLGLSATQDSDNDGITDADEHTLRLFGFDWKKSQPDLVKAFLAANRRAGFFQPEDCSQLSATSSIILGDPETNSALLQLGFQQSDDLSSFATLPVDPGHLSVNEEGKIEYEIPLSAGRRFFQIQIEE